MDIRDRPSSGIYLRNLEAMARKQGTDVSFIDQNLTYGENMDALHLRAGGEDMAGNDSPGESIEEAYSKQQERISQLEQEKDEERREKERLREERDMALSRGSRKEGNPWEEAVSASRSGGTSRFSGEAHEGINESGVDEFSRKAKGAAGSAVSGISKFLGSAASSGAHALGEGSSKLGAAGKSALDKFNASRGTPEERAARRQKVWNAVEGFGRSQGASGGFGGPSFGAFAAQGPGGSLGAFSGGSSGLAAFSSGGLGMFGGEQRVRRRREQTLTTKSGRVYRLVPREGEEMGQAAPPNPLVGFMSQGGGNNGMFAGEPNPMLAAGSGRPDYGRFAVGGSPGRVGGVISDRHRSGGGLARFAVGGRGNHNPFIQGKRKKR